MTCGHLHPQSQTGDPADTIFDKLNRGRISCKNVIHLQKSLQCKTETNCDMRGKVHVSGKSSRICSFSPVHFNVNGTFTITDSRISRIWAILSIYDEKNHLFLKSNLFSSISLNYWAAYLQSNIEPRPTSVAHCYFLHYYPLLLAARVTSCGFSLISCSEESI